MLGFFYLTSVEKFASTHLAFTTRARKLCATSSTFMQRLSTILYTFFYDICFAIPSTVNGRKGGTRDRFKERKGRARK